MTPSIQHSAITLLILVWGKNDTSDDVVFQLGTLRLEVELYDLQARTVAAIKEFEVPIVVTVEKPR